MVRGRPKGEAAGRADLHASERQRRTCCCGGRPHSVADWTEALDAADTGHAGARTGCLAVRSHVQRGACAGAVAAADQPAHGRACARRCRVRQCPRTVHRVRRAQGRRRACV